VRKPLQTLTLVFTIALGAAAPIRAQDKPAAPPTVTGPAIRRPLEAVTPLKVQVVIARYQGEKKITSMPYTLTMNAGGRSNIRMGSTIPISTTNGSKDAAAGGSFQYKDVGTNIDCVATEVEGGRYALNITVDDSSVYPDETAKVVGNPSFRSFRAANTMVLKHGETGQFTTATDKVSGETVKIDVTLTVMK
jgi:hypothetical protein